MKESELLIETVDREHIEIVADILANDDESSDSEVVDTIVDNTSLTKSVAIKIVKELRPRYLRGDFLTNSNIENEVKIIKRFLK